MVIFFGGWFIIAILFISGIFNFKTLQNKSIQINDNIHSWLESNEIILDSSNQWKSWKPVYIEQIGARMSNEQMNYILTNYWNKDNKNNKINNNNDNVDKNQNENEDENEQNDNANIENIENVENNDNNDNNKPEIVSSSSSLYPSGWKLPCENDPYDENCIKQHIKYWTKGTSKINKNKEINNKYVTFLKDCGGLNNIRQAFEFHVMVAWLTNRTLVLPPDEPWYLIDFGPITRGKNEKRGTKSNYDSFWDLNDLRKVVPIITSSEFINKEIDHLNIPINFCCNKINNNDEIKQNYISWLNDQANILNCNLPWGQLGNIIYWPNETIVQHLNHDKIDSMYIDNRKTREYDEHLKQQIFIHFPSCTGKEGSQNLDYRFLGQIARAIAFDNYQMDQKYKQILRDFVHLTPEIFDYASQVIKLLGIFQYSSFHIRRNDLQYKYVFVEPKVSYDATKYLLKSKEKIYIATDEMDENFFKIFEQHYIVYRWKDFFGSESKFEQTKNIQIPPKLHGSVEMVICALGRLFFGTKESTFTSYITRIRGYVNAPYAKTLYHHIQLDVNGNVDLSEKLSLEGFYRKDYRGQIYKIEFPELWNDIQDYYGD